MLDQQIDLLPSYANDNEARISNNGAYPPDLSVITKAKKYGEDYIYNLFLDIKILQKIWKLEMECITINGWLEIKYAMPATNI